MCDNEMKNNEYITQASQGDNAYTSNCKRCGKFFFTNDKYRVYCEACGEILDVRKTNEQLMKDNEILMRDNQDLKDILKGMYKNLGIVLKTVGVE